MSGVTAKPLDPAETHGAALVSLVLLFTCSLLLAGKIMIARAAIDSGLQPMQLAIIGNLGAALVLFALVRASGQRIPTGREHLVLYVVLGAISFAIPTVVAYSVVGPVGPAYVSSVYSLSPILTMALAAGFGIERLSWRRTAGILFGFAGMIALVRHQLVSVDLDATFWVVLGLSIPLAAAVGNVVRTAWWPKDSSALAFSCATLFTSVALLALVGPLIEDVRTWRLGGWDMTRWTGAMIVVSAVSYVANYAFQKLAGPVVFSQIGYWGTGFGVVLAALLFGDTLGVRSLAGVAMIVAGGVLARKGGT